jgi:hypothetical protein
MNRVYRHVGEVINIGVAMKHVLARAGCLKKFTPGIHPLC